MQDATASTMQANLETTVVPESPEIAIGSDKEKDSDTTAIVNVSKKNADVHSHSDEESPVDKTLALSIAKRLRSNS
ncbi:hypothetical protein A2U01_0056714, partial [Trifolium medium]|nr:hypothetical protein [Trifolium medium]